MKKPRELIQDLRALRAEERRLRSSLIGDLRPFQKDDLSFFTLPDSVQDGKISTATTCTALMALVDSNDVRALLPPESTARNGDSGFKRAVAVPERPLVEVLEAWRKLFANVVGGSWKSSGLLDLNAFTTCMVARATGFLASSGVIPWTESQKLKHKLTESLEKNSPFEQIAKDKAELSLGEILHTMADKAERSFAVSGYPAKTTLGYWFVHGITEAGIEIPDTAWKSISDWAAGEFYRQLTYVVSGNDALMDPASLAMAACLINRIGGTAAKKEELSPIGKKLPSIVELTHAVDQVFERQAESGIWHKSFPLFHFPGSGAADYCFSFEFLEAILIEFSGSDLIIRPSVLKGLEKAVQWCKDHRFAFRDGNKTFMGWNAGGDVTRLAAGMPEAWATSVVHMFLWELESALSMSLQKLLLTEFRAQRPPVEKWNELIDVDLDFPGGEKPTLLEVAHEELIVRAADTNETTLRRRSLKDRRSALLFGPPGTSKTTFAKAIAGKLGWPLLVVTPSDFLNQGLEQIYIRVTEIFEDLMDLSGVVVFFDEMDALAQNRGGNTALDVTRQLLTTSMLPKLTDLHDQGRVMFLMATNHKKDLDPAVTRPGRFDLLLCVGPPNWERKRNRMSIVLKDFAQPGDLKKIEDSLKRLSDSPGTIEGLDLFTVSDLRNFLEHLQRRAKTQTLLSALEQLPKEAFEQDVKSWVGTYITLNTEQETLLKEFNDDRVASRIQ